jgi:predicted acetyltransferase
MRSEPARHNARLIAPCLGYVASYLEALREGHSDTTDPHLQVPLAVIEADPGAHIAALSGRETVIRLPDGTEMGSVPYAHLWLVAGDELIGRVSIRYALNQRLLRFGGHIGYGIRPSRRRQGFGRQALVLAKADVRAHGLSRVLLTCADSNVGSARIIESCGGELENIEPHSDPPHVMTRRYWIDLDRDAST